MNKQRIMNTENHTGLTSQPANGSLPASTRGDGHAIWKAKNTKTGLWFIEGEGFVSKAKNYGTELTAAALVVVQHCFLNVEAFQTIEDDGTPSYCKAPPKPSLLTFAAIRIEKLENVRVCADAFLECVESFENPSSISDGRLAERRMPKLKSALDAALLEASK